MTIERFEKRIQETVVENAPAILRGVVEKQVPGLLEFSLDLLLETFETDCPDLLAQVDAAPSSYPQLWEKLERARKARKTA